MKLSIIIPVYNVEQYLQECVASVLAQTYSDFEIILVDDCSPDRCPQLCDEIAGTDNRIRVVHRPVNGGLSAARNTGIDIAEGNFITFVDSDDTIKPDTYTANIQILEKSDAMCLEYPVIKNTGNKKEEIYLPFSGNGYRIETFHNWVERDGFVHSYAWNKIYRRILWKSCRFPEGKYFEDLATIPYVIENAGKIIVTSLGGYHYNTSNDKSITQTPSFQKSQDLLENTLCLYSFLRNKGFSKADTYQLYMEAVDRQIDFMRAGGNIEIKNIRPSLSDILSSQTAPRRIKACALSLLPQKWFYQLMKRI